MYLPREKAKASLRQGKNKEDGVVKEEALSGQKKREERGGERGSDT